MALRVQLQAVPARSAISVRATKPGRQQLWRAPVYSARPSDALADHEVDHNVDWPVAAASAVRSYDDVRDLNLNHLARQAAAEALANDADENLPRGTDILDAEDFPLSPVSVASYEDVTTFYRQKK